MALNALWVGVTKSKNMDSHKFRICQRETGREAEETEQKGNGNSPCSNFDETETHRNKATIEAHKAYRPSPTAYIIVFTYITHTKLIVWKICMPPLVSAFSRTKRNTVHYTVGLTIV